MNILVPLAGRGARFQSDGYQRAKPLVRALGKPLLRWLLEGLALRPDDAVYVGHCEGLALASALPRGLEVRCCVVPPTRGALETLIELCAQLPAARRHLPTVSLDGDTFYRVDVLALCRGLGGCGTITFETHEAEPIYSYVRTDERGERVLEVREKQRISSLANTGCYVLPSAAELLRDAAAVLAHWERERPAPEPYVSIYLQWLIERGAVLRTRTIAADAFVVLGTPHQVKTFCSSHAAAAEPQRFCFDLDGTLVTECDDYERAEPIAENVALLRYLKQLGHTIIIYTARRMRTHRGNAAAALADAGAVTLRTLERFGIPCDELCFGKPHADVYIDDRALNPQLCDVQRELGFYNAQAAERDFNRVQLAQLRAVRKTSQDGHKMEAECCYYERLPAALRDLFPAYYGRVAGGYQLEYVDGLTLAYLHQHGSLRWEHVELLLAALQRLHGCALAPDEAAAAAPQLYANYADKLELRRSEHRELYAALDADDRLYTALLPPLRRYEAEHRAQLARVHGDPVFTNVLLTAKERLCLIDPRGLLGSLITAAGDKAYDYAKVYQSLLGYDLALQGLEPHCSALAPHFLQHAKAALGDSAQFLPAITASLLYSLLPLHSKHQALFVRMAQALVDSFEPAANAT